jgi:hypothetical protein
LQVGCEFGYTVVNDSVLTRTPVLSSLTPAEAGRSSRFNITKLGRSGWI